MTKQPSKKFGDRFPSACLLRIKCICFSTIRDRSICQSTQPILIRFLRISLRLIEEQQKQLGMDKLAGRLFQSLAAATKKPFRHKTWQLHLIQKRFDRSNSELHDRNELWDVINLECK